MLWCRGDGSSVTRSVPLAQVTIYCKMGCLYNSCSGLQNTSATKDLHKGFHSLTQLSPIRHPGSGETGLHIHVQTLLTISQILSCTSIPPHSHLFIQTSIFDKELYERTLLCQRDTPYVRGTLLVTKEPSPTKKLFFFDFSLAIIF